MAKYFTSIIFYHSIHPQTEHLRNTLTNSPFIKVFSPLDREEVQQIVNMSERTVIASDHKDLLSLNIKEGKALGRGKFRKYFLDWVPREDHRPYLSLGQDGTLVIKTDEIIYAIEKFELFLFGCIDVYKKQSFRVPVYSKDEFGKYFFTHLSYVNGEWKMMISTHEREKDISKLLGKDWEILVADVLSHTARYKRPTEEVLIKPYFQVIFPHFKNGKLQRLTIAHLVYNSHVTENLARFYKFLEAIAA